MHPQEWLVVWAASEVQVEQVERVEKAVLELGAENLRVEVEYENGRPIKRGVGVGLQGP